MQLDTYAVCNTLTGEIIVLHEISTEHEALELYLSTQYETDCVSNLIVLPLTQEDRIYV